MAAQDPLQQIRRMIEEDHERLIASVEHLAGYLASRNLRLEILPGNGTPVSTSTDTLTGPTTGFTPDPHFVAGTFKDRVEAVISGAFASVDTIAASTNLTHKQIRGVVYSPLLRHRYERVDTKDGQKAFRLKQNADELKPEEKGKQERAGKAT